MTQRFHLPPGGDVPEQVAARRMGETVDEFRAHLAGLLARGFPPPDETTGRFCLEAIDQWRTHVRYPHLYGDRLTVTGSARDARAVVSERVAQMSRRHGNA